MGFRVNADQIKTNYTDTLSRFTADLKYEDIPAEVRPNSSQCRRWAWGWPRRAPPSLIAV